MTWGFGEYMFTGCCTAGTFISFHDLFYLVLNVKINNSGVRIVSSLLGSMNTWLWRRWRGDLSIGLQLGDQPVVTPPPAIT